MPIAPTHPPKSPMHAPKPRPAIHAAAPLPGIAPTAAMESLVQTPIAIAVTITSVEAPPGFGFSGSGTPDDKTGLRNDLKVAEAAAAKAHAALTETPILSLTAADGVPGAATTQTTFPFVMQTAYGAPQNGGLQTLIFDSRLQVTATRLPSGFVHAKIAFRHTHAVGIAWRELAPPVAETVSGGLEDTFKSGETVFVAKIPAAAPTGRLYFATITLLPPTKG